ncbi:hypothetical protein [Thalassotalea mangrovi]|uniref:START domain-containing protein n=1 Tax=Thalassotalea mangrovi TaxID=2572245 RepID=A0A4U1B2E7_9GAMM|nr:hypothetical protein [Thalassotalea mangrovi]TKB43355.1 hypothetical protein E8M12_15285 [Thalassotalea mangrovi]
MTVLTDLLRIWRYLLLTACILTFPAIATSDAPNSDFPTQQSLPLPWYTHMQNEWLWIQYRDKPDTGFVEIKASLTLQTQLNKIRYLLTDKKAVLSWVAGVKRIVVFEKQNDHQVQLTILDPIWPVHAREMLTTNSLINNTNQFTLTVQDHNQYLKPNPNRIRVERVNITWQVKQLEDNIVDVQYLGYFQPGGSLPAWLSNEIFLVLISDSLTNLKAVIDGIESAKGTTAEIQ